MLLLPVFVLAGVSATDTDGVASGYTIESTGTSITIDTPVHNNTIYGLYMSNNGNTTSWQCYPDVAPQAPCTYDLSTSPYNTYTQWEIHAQRNNNLMFGDDLIIVECGAGDEVVFVSDGTDGCDVPLGGGGDPELPPYTYGSTTYPIFAGFITSYVTTYPQESEDVATTTIQAVDAFRLAQLIW